MTPRLRSFRLDSGSSQARAAEHVDGALGCRAASRRCAGLTRTTAAMGMRSPSPPRRLPGTQGAQVRRRHRPGSGAEGERCLGRLRSGRECERELRSHPESCTRARATRIKKVSAGQMSRVCPGRRGRGLDWHPRPQRGCYLTITQPYILSTAKCGVMLQRMRYRPGVENVPAGGVYGP